MPPRLPTQSCAQCRLPKQRHAQPRPFTTTPPRQVQPKTNALSLLPPSAPPPPPYPFPPAYFYKQRNSGLYGTAMLQFGNNVSERTETKTRRRWAPNIVVKSLYSRALGRSVRVKVATRVLRTVDKVGGLDEYLLGQGAARVRELGVEGWRLRWAVLNSGVMKKSVAGDPKMRAMVEGWREVQDVGNLEKEAVVKNVVKKTRPNPSRKKEDFELSDADREALEARIARKSERYRHMAERAKPMTLWQRVRRAVISPFRRN